jgi:hypothetical protein
MRAASPGDLVLSYADQTVKYVGRVAEFAITAPKPTEFGSTGAYWNNEGWWLPVFWTPLQQPVRPKVLIDLLRPLLPPKHSPIDPDSGSGYQSVYLASIPKGVFDLVVAGTAFDSDLLARGGANSLTFPVLNELLDDLVEKKVSADFQLEDTVRKSVVQARRGQGKFRSNVEAVERACRLTGISNPTLLIASHIKPWRLCSSADERLDGMNGLLLTPDADLLFDRGFISFGNGGEVMVSPRVDREDLRRLGFRQLAWDQFGFGEVTPWQTEAFAAAQCNYLSYHRSEIFVS